MRNGSVIATTNDAMPSCTRLPPSFNLLPPLQPQSLLLVGIQACGNAMIGQHGRLVHDAIAYIFGAKAIPTSLQFSSSSLNARLGRELVFDNESAARGCASDAILDVHPISEAGVRGGRQFWGKRRSGQSRVEGKRLSGYGS